MDKTNPTVHLYQPPILGFGASVRCIQGGHLVLGTLGNFGSKLAKGFTLGIDIQSERKSEQVILGSFQSSGTGILITYNDSNKLNQIRIHVQDNAGRKLIAVAVLSNRAGKRLIIRINPPKNFVAITEITISSYAQQSINYLANDSPQDFSNFDEPLIVSGYRINGTRKGDFIGRLANLFLLKSTLEDNQIVELNIATSNEITSIYGHRCTLQSDLERRNVFRDDLAKLRQWNKQASLAKPDTLDASTVIFKWLFDKHPMLLDICDEIGVQLSFPCTNQEGQQYIDKLFSLKPSYYQAGMIGAGSPHGFDWMPLAIFSKDIAFQINGHTVTHESFVKLVRHKLGGAHFDTVDRKKWERDLKAYSDKIQIGGVDAICYQMKMLIQALIQSVDGCGIEQQI